MSAFNERLRELRLKYYSSQSQLAKRLHMASSTISSYEKAERCPSMDVLIKLSDALHCSTDYLLGLESRQNLEISDLTENQIVLIAQLIEEFKISNQRNQKGIRSK